MKLLTLLSFQAFAIALLCSSVLTEKRGATLDQLIKALGSLYQHKLFSVRDEADEVERLGGLIVGGEPVRPVPALHETVSVPRFQYCMENIPYCVTFYGTMIVQEKPLKRSGPERKTVRNTQDQLCLKDIKLGSCSDPEITGPYGDIVDVSGLEIPDFCFPGMIKLAGQIEFLETVTSSMTVHVQMNPTNLPKRSNKNYKRASCSQVEYFYNVCDLLDRSDNCPNPHKPRNGYDPLPIPCDCDMEGGLYDVSSFEKMVNTVDFFGMGERSGFAVVSSDEGKSCFSFNFTGTTGSF